MIIDYMMPKLGKQHCMLSIGHPHSLCPQKNVHNFSLE